VPHERPEHTKDAIPHGKGELILIVDDEENIRNVAEANPEQIWLQNSHRLWMELMPSRSTLRNGMR
jgi:hypothetical protein